MSDIAIEVSNLSKRYRIGLKEQISDSFIGSVVSLLRSPISNYKKVRNLSIFSDNDESEDILWALKDVSFNVKQGEVLGVIGRNGAGKSTLLKILCQITEPTLGRAVVNGRVSSLLEVGTGFHPELSGRENVFLNGAILGMSKQEIDQKFDEIVEFSGVEKFIETPVKRYSSGMRVRLAFAVAAHLDPDVLLVDEVLAVGDAEFRKKAFGKMKDVSENRGRTVLLVSHNMQAIQELCPNSILLDKGSIVANGKSYDVVNKYLIGTGLSSGEDLMSAIELNQTKETDGTVKFTDLKILDKNLKERFNYERGEQVFFHIYFKVLRLVENLIHALIVYSGQSGEILVHIPYIISDKPLKAGYQGKIILQLSTDSLNEGEFPLAFLLHRKGIRKDCDFIPSSVIPPLGILNKRKCKESIGIISMQSSINHFKV